MRSDNDEWFGGKREEFLVIRTKAQKKKKETVQDQQIWRNISSDQSDDQNLSDQSKRTWQWWLMEGGMQQGMEYMLKDRTLNFDLIWSDT